MKGLFLLCAAIGHANTYSVTNTNDSGSGSFRQAVLNANANAGPDIITFTGGLETITVASYISLNGTVAMNGNGTQVVSGGTTSNLVYFAAGSDGSTITGPDSCESWFSTSIVSGFSNCPALTRWKFFPGIAVVWTQVFISA